MEEQPLAVLHTEKYNFCGEVLRSSMGKKAKSIEAPDAKDISHAPVAEKGIVNQITAIKKALTDMREKAEVEYSYEMKAMLQEEIDEIKRCAEDALMNAIHKNFARLINETTRVSNDLFLYRTYEGAFAIYEKKAREALDILEENKAPWAIKFREFFHLEKVDFETIDDLMGQNTAQFLYCGSIQSLRLKSDETASISEDYLPGYRTIRACERFATASGWGAFRHQLFLTDKNYELAEKYAMLCRTMKGYDGYMAS
ncbi:MAG: hypothetical protein JSS82_12645 [Bacteroidetes bacterium]|nr:hypothetical protein [Bacteroidota bacterium]